MKSGQIISKMTIRLKKKEQKSKNGEVIKGKTAIETKDN
jgi:hypothetical protein